MIPWHEYDLSVSYNDPPHFRLGGDSLPETLAWVTAKVALLALPAGVSGGGGVATSSM